MPLYEYECTKCGRRVEVIQKFSDPPKTRCDACKGALKKLPSAPAIQFKGSGWYVTDYGRGGSGGRKGEGKDSSKESTAKESSSGESSAKDSSGTSKKPDSSPADPPVKKKRG